MLGRIVFYRIPDSPKGIELRPAIVTRVHNPEVVNLRVLADPLDGSSRVPGLTEVRLGGDVGMWREAPE